MLGRVRSWRPPPRQRPNAWPAEADLRGMMQFRVQAGRLDPDALVSTAKFVQGRGYTWPRVFATCCATKAKLLAGMFLGTGLRPTLQLVVRAGAGVTHVMAPCSLGLTNRTWQLSRQQVHGSPVAQGPPLLPTRAGCQSRMDFRSLPACSRVTEYAVRSKYRHLFLDLKTPGKLGRVTSTVPMT